MDDHAVSWNVVLLIGAVGYGAGALGYILGAASALAVGGAVRRERIAMAARAGVGTAARLARKSKTAMDRTATGRA